MSADALEEESKEWRLGREEGKVEVYRPSVVQSVGSYTWVFLFGKCPRNDEAEMTSSERKLLKSSDPSSSGRKGQGRTCPVGNRHRLAKQPAAIISSERRAIVFLDTALRGCHRLYAH